MMGIYRLNASARDSQIGRCLNVDLRTVGKYREEIELELKHLIVKVEMEQKRIEEENKPVLAKIASIFGVK